MFKAVSNVIIVALIFVAFIGQTLALNMVTTCKSSLDVQHANVSERAQVKKPVAVDTDMSTPCCDIDCICIANTCSSIVFLTDFAGVSRAFILTEIAFIQPSDQPKAFVSLLYRPPIAT